MKKTLIIFPLLILSFSVIAQINQYGNVIVRNYDSKQYKAAEQNWAAIQDSRGIMFFGNNDFGVLEFDGVTWNNIPVRNNSIVRSLAIDQKDRIYVGAIGEFGYLEPDQLGKLTYISLIGLLDEDQKQFGDIWKTYIIGDYTVFCEMQKIFVYGNNKINIIPLPEDNFLSYQVDSTLYTFNTALGLLELTDRLSSNAFTKESFRLVKNGEYFIGKPVMGITKSNDNELIISTYDKGLFHYNTASGEAHQIVAKTDARDATAFMKANLIFHSEKISDQLIAHASYQGGAFTNDYEGNIEHYINIASGLQDKTVNYLYKSTLSAADNQLWLALNRGISKAEVNSPIRLFEQITNVNAIIKFENRIYTASDDGVKYLSYNQNQLPEFIDIEELKGTQSWSFLKFNPVDDQKNDILLVGNFDGIYTLKNQQCEKIASPDNRILYNSIKNPNIIYSGNDGGLSHIEYKNGTWTDKGKIGNFTEIIQNITEDKNNNLWLGTYFNGVIKIDEKDSTIRRYNTSDGLPSMKNNILFNINKELLAATEKGVYRFDFEKDKFEPFAIFGDRFAGRNIGVTKVIRDQHDNYWLIAFDENRNWIVKISRQGGKLNILESPFKRIPSMSYQSIYTDDKNITWIGGPDGIYTFNNNLDIDYNEPYHTLIRNVTIGEDSVIFKGTNFNYTNDRKVFITNVQKEEDKPEIAYSKNSISFEYASPFFVEEKKTLYSHQLVGFNKDWTKWDSETKAVFTNLNKGDYRFKVKAKNIYGLESTIANYEFTILAPWYQTIVAYISYVILFVLLLYVLIKLNTRRLEKEKQILEGIVKERTAEVVKQKEEIEKAYENVKMLSKIGQDVTANLSIAKIVDTVYQNVNKLMDASFFAVGIHIKKSNELEFLGKESLKGDIQKSSDSLDNKKLMSTHCFLNQKELIINDFSNNDFNLEFFNKDKKELSRESFLYIPLTTKKKQIGIITVQSPQKNAYTDYHLNMLKNLAVYTAIALDNAEAYEQIEAQKNIVVKQKQEITDSILYAKRIQNAVLPPEEIISKNFPEHFVLFKPRDIVSGDFFWMKKVDNYAVLTVADCTGHGVPGAFMSMLGIALLNEIVRKPTILSASEVLNKLRNQVKSSLRQTGRADEAKDGMDISLCIIDMQKQKMNFAGAYNPLYLFRKKTKSSDALSSHIAMDNDEFNLIEIKSDKMPIGIHLKEKESFTEYEIDIVKGDTYYIFTDGYADQMGGKKRKKFMAKPFKKLLLGIQDEPMQKQHDILDKTIEDWKSYPDDDGQGYPQMDDITIMGIKF